MRPQTPPRPFRSPRPRRRRACFPETCRNRSSSPSRDSLSVRSKSLSTRDASFKSNATKGSASRTTPTRSPVFRPCASRPEPRRAAAGCRENRKRTTGADRGTPLPCRFLSPLARRRNGLRRLGSPQTHGLGLPVLRKSRETSFRRILLINIYTYSIDISLFLPATGRTFRSTTSHTHPTPRRCPSLASSPFR